MNSNEVVADFIRLQRELLKLEQQAEIAEAAKVNASTSHAGLERRGVALTRMTVLSSKTSLYGRTVVTFVSSRGGPAGGFKLPANKMKAGDIVEVGTLSSSSSGTRLKRLASGVVTRMTAHAALVAFEEMPAPEQPFGGKGLVLLKLANEVTYKRLTRTLNDLGGTGPRYVDQPCPAIPVIKALFGGPMETPRRASYSNGKCFQHAGQAVAPSTSFSPASASASAAPAPASSATSTFPALPSRLNASQQHAIAFCLEGHAVSVIHGPPGTGKTTTVVELIVQLVARGYKVLAATPSNIAVDNLVERLAAAKPAAPDVLRIGHPARLLQSVQHLSLDARVDASDEAGLVRDIRKEMDSLYAKMGGWGRSQISHGSSSSSGGGAAERCTPGARAGYRSEYKDLRKELRRREKDALRQALKTADVVLGTLTSIAPDGPLGLLPEDHFDVVVIDEAGQALEAACWTALLRAPTCVLAGDHLQLPPTITSATAAKRGLATTLLERAVEMVGDGYVQMLDTQYRMHEKIMRWSSDSFYGGKLVAADSVAGHTLASLPSVAAAAKAAALDGSDGGDDNFDADDLVNIPLAFIDTAGCGLEESNGSSLDKSSSSSSSGGGGGSRVDDTLALSHSNPGEAELVLKHVGELLAAGVLPSDIGVITPYNGQVEELRAMLSEPHPDVEVRTVDGFQGREKEAIVISMVRCNARRIVGFLSEQRRMNVAVTRAKRHLAIIGDSVTVSSDPHLARLVDHLSAEGDVRTAFEHMELLGAVPNPELSMQQGMEANRDAKRKKEKERKEERGDHATSGAPQTRRLQYQTLLATFLNDETKLEMELPLTLNSFERRLVHEIATELALGHRSTGSATARQITIWKPNKGSSVEEAAATSEPISDSSSNGYSSGSGADSEVRTADTIVAPNVPQTAALERPQQRKETKLIAASAKGAAAVTAARLDAGPQKLCPSCSKLVPKGNFEIHEMRCAREKRRAAAAASSPPPPPLLESVTAKGKRKSKGKGKGTGNGRGGTKSGSAAGLSTAEAEAEVDALLAEMHIASKTCEAKGCGKSIATIGQVCVFCSRGYCLKHILPEVHGCGDDASRAARARVMRGQNVRVAVQGKGSGKRSEAARKLAKALAEKESSREKKPKKKKKPTKKKK